MTSSCLFHSMGLLHRRSPVPLKAVTLHGCKLCGVTMQSDVATLVRGPRPLKPQKRQIMRADVRTYEDTVLFYCATTRQIDYAQRWASLRVGSGASWIRNASRTSRVFATRRSVVC